LLQSIGFEPYVVLGTEDFKEMLRHGGKLLREGYAEFDPYALMESPAVTDHVKALVQDFL
jgi:hypothetical protein